MTGLCSGGHAQTLQLSLDEGRALARQAALNGEYATAVNFAEALLDADPNDRIALLTLAVAKPNLGSGRDGQRAGARAFRLSENDAQRFEAARLTALAAASDERFTASQYWLRRAAAHAPNEQAQRQARQDFQNVRRLNPFTFNLSGSVRKSNNLNGGTDGACLFIDGISDGEGAPLCGLLSGDAQALPGWSANADLRLSYDVSRTQNQVTSLTARGYTRHVWLSDEARALSPTTRNSDFASQVVELGLRHRRRAADGTLTLEGIYGGSWFGGDLSANYTRGRLSYSQNISEQTQLSVSAQLDAINIQTGAQRTNFARTLTASATHRINDQNSVNATVSFSGQSSDSTNDRFENARLQLGYTWNGPVQVSIGAGMFWADYRDYRIAIITVPGGRQDTRTFGDISIAFPNIDYAGFSPVFSTSYQDTNSNVSRFDRDEFNWNISLRSNF